MNLRELAHKDSAVTVEGAQAGTTICDLFDAQNNKWEVLMLLSDIGYMVDGEGNQTAGRSCWATYVANRVKDSNMQVLYPREGWRLEWTDLGGERQQMYVSYCMPDRTLGLNKLFMTSNLEAASEAAYEYEHRT